MRLNGRTLAAGAAVVATLAVVAAGVVAARDTGPAQPIGAAPPAAATPAAGPEVEVAGDRYAFSGTELISGEEISLSDFRGKPTVINIWASWCHGCNAEAHDLAEFAAEHPEAHFVGVHFQDSESAGKAFYEQYGWKFPSVYDPRGDIAFHLGLQGTPTTIFLDSEHREVARIIGETDQEGFAKGLAAASAAQ